MVPNEFHVLKSYFDTNKHQYNFSSKSDCGEFTERFLIHLRTLSANNKFKHLRKYGSQTQHNKHAIDVLAYDNRGQGDGTPVMEIDILGSAESANANPTWQVRETAYEPKDFMEPSEVGQPVAPAPPVIKFPEYEELGGDNLCRELLGKVLEADYKEAKQALNDGSVVWTNQTIYIALRKVFVDGIKPEQAYKEAVYRQRPGWRKALGL